MRIVFLISVFALSLLMVGCGGDRQPATPKETFETYVKAIKKKDLTTMKLLLSNETIKMHEQEAKAMSITLDDVVKRQTLVAEQQTVVSVRNEVIDGQKATLEVKNQFDAWEKVPFVFEDNAWKIDKKGYADQLLEQNQQDQQQLDDIINQGRQP